MAEPAPERTPPDDTTEPHAKSTAEQLINECRIALRAAGILHKDAADRLGITRQHMSRLMRGHQRLTTDRADQIAAMCRRRIVVTSVDSNGPIKLERDMPDDDTAEDERQ